MTTEAQTSTSTAAVRRHRRYSFGGGVLGLVTYAVIALLPTLIYSSTAGVMLTSALLGGPIGDGLLPRAILAATVLFPVMVFAALFTWAGSALGGLAQQVTGGTAIEPGTADPAPELMAPRTTASPERRGAYAGGAVGLVAYLLVGFMPSLVYGALGSVVVVGAILGHPLEGGLAERLVVLAGTVLAIVGAGAAATGAGALAGRSLVAWSSRETEILAEPEVVEQAPPVIVRVPVTAMTEVSVPNPTAERRDRFTFWGGALGLVAFAFVGLMPSLVYGGFAGAILAAGILGHPVDAGLLARGIVAFGMLIGLLATAALFVVTGAASGSGVHVLVDAVESFRARSGEVAGHGVGAQSKGK